MDREIETLIKWSDDDTSEMIFFTDIDKELDSYYTLREPNQYYREYDPQSIDDIRKELLGLWKDRSSFTEIIDVVAVSAIRNKVLPAHVVQKSESQKNDELKPYIYNF